MRTIQIAAVCLVAATHIAVGANSALAALPDPACVTIAIQLRERLEAVTEAVIDGRTGAVPGAAERALSWWQGQQTPSISRAEPDSLLRLAVGAAHHHEPLQAARLAVDLSAKSFTWCPGPPSTADRLMLLDLAGMTGWLRGRGETLAWPAGVQEAADTIGKTLVGRHRQDLAGRLKSSVATVISAGEGPKGDIRPATRLLDLVDEIEKALR